MRLIAAGLTQRQIARRVGLAGSAITARTWRMRTRIGATSTAHAVALLAAAGLLDLTQIRPISTGGTTR